MKKHWWCVGLLVVCLSNLVYGSQILLPERQELWNRIIEITGAERDWVREAQHSPLLGELASHIKDPREILLQGQAQTYILNTLLTVNDSIFEPLDELTHRLTEPYHPLQPTEQNLLHQVITLYQSFRDRLINAGVNGKLKKSLCKMSISLVSEDGTYYLISPKMARTLISKDKYGSPVRQQGQTGNQAVSAQGGVHFKCLESSLGGEPRPGHEFMTYAFAASLTPDPLITPSLLLKVDNLLLFNPSSKDLKQFLLRFQQEGDCLEQRLERARLQTPQELKTYLTPHTFFVQATRTIGTKDLSKHLEEDTLELDPTNVSWHFLLTLLLRLEDGKADNYSAEETDNGHWRIIGIDNDKLLYPPLYPRSSQKPNEWGTCLKSIFFSWDRVLTYPLSSRVRESILNYSVDTFFWKWLVLLEKQNQVYQNLGQKGLLEPHHFQVLGLPLRLPPHMVEGIHHQWTDLQRLFKEHQTIRLGDLLQHFYPTVAAYYQRIRQVYPNDPLATQWVVYRGYDDQNREYPIQEILGPQKEWVGSDQEVDFSQEITLPPVGPGFWHSLVKTHSPQILFAWAKEHYPEGVDSLDAVGKNPLDYAIDCLETNSNSYFFQTLTDYGAQEMTTSSERLYEIVSRNPLLRDAFDRLKRRNGQVAWEVSLGEIFPKRKGQDPVLTGSISGERHLLSDVSDQLADEKRKTTFARRQVTRVQRNGQTLYVKIYPEVPGVEEAVSILTRMVIGFGAPCGELFRLPDGRPSWISQGIEGDTLQEVLSHYPQRLTQLDPASLSDMILMAMLINPADGKSDNYVMEPLPDEPTRYRLVGIDNDHAFVPAFVKEARTGGKPTSVIQVKTVLYCLDAMQESIHPITRKRFLGLDFNQLLVQWLSKLDTRYQAYSTLYPNVKEVLGYLLQHDSFIGIPLQKGMITHLYNKLMSLKELITQHPQISHFDLLHKLEPQLAKHYQKSFIDNLSLKDRFELVDKGFYEQSRRTFTTLTHSGRILESQDIPLRKPTLMRKSTLKMIRSNPNLGSKEAQEELWAIQLQKTQLPLSFEDALLNTHLEEKLREVSFSGHTPRKQKALLKKIFGSNIRKLTLHDSALFSPIRND